MAWEIVTKTRDLLCAALDHRFSYTWMGAVRTCQRCGQTDDLVREGEVLRWVPRNGN